MAAQRFIEDNSSGFRLDSDLGNLSANRVLTVLDRDVTVADARVNVVDTSSGNQTVTFDGAVGELVGYRKSGSNTLTVNRNGTNTFVGGGTSFVVGDVAFFVLTSAGVIEQVNVASAADNSVTNAKLADMAANTIKGNPTGATADPQDIAVPASTFVGRADTGNITAMTPAQARAVLRRAKQTLTVANPQNWDLANGLYFERPGATTNFTLNFPSNAQEGETAFMVFPNGNSATVTLAAGFKMMGTGGSSTTLPGGECRLEFFFTSSTTCQVSQTNFS